MFNDLVVRFLSRGRRIPDSKSNSTEDPPNMWLHAKSYVGVQTSFSWYGAEAWRGICRIRGRLTLVKNYEVHSKIAAVLLQDGTLKLLKLKLTFPLQINHRNGLVTMSCISIGGSRVRDPYLLEITIYVEPMHAVFSLIWLCKSGI
ncbi:hypothetical protein AVEN_122251-1 [Araneus ventricosus]|uniref:Uncharacterized protein n=1 Tax=Araneus ventricosus TaxID=182803 RepID=A0A4Y2H9D1_ARAVE|nr:hypothetical protein AVEN_122251-1 [Araneus ventricosus]